MIASIFSGLLSSALSGIASSFAQAANSFLAVLFRLLNTSTSLSLSGSSFLTEFNAVFMIGLLVALALALIELGAGALQRNASRVAKVPLNLVLMVVGTVASVSLIDMLLTISDQLSAGLLQATGFSLSTTGMSAALAVVATQPGTELMLAVFIIIAVICCYFALVVRRVLIIVAAVMAPLALAGATATATRSWVRRWSETMLALIFSKVILVIVLITGFHLLQGAGATNIASAMAGLIGGVGLLFIAAFSPLMALKMVTFTGGHFAEAALLGHQAVSAAAAPVKKVAHVGTAAATGGASAAAGAALGVGLGHARPRPATPSGTSAPSSSRDHRTPSAPSAASTSVPADDASAGAATASRASQDGHGEHEETTPWNRPTGAASDSRHDHSSSAPSRGAAVLPAGAESSTTPPTKTPGDATATRVTGSGAPDVTASRTANAPARDASGVGESPMTPGTTPLTSAASEAPMGTVKGPTAASFPTVVGDDSSSAEKPSSPVARPSSGRVNAERPSPPEPLTPTRTPTTENPLTPPSIAEST